MSYKNRRNKKKGAACAAPARESGNNLLPSRLAQMQQYSYESIPQIEVLDLPDSQYNFEHVMASNPQVKQAWDQCVCASEYMFVIKETINFKTTMATPVKKELASDKDLMPPGLRYMRCPMPELVDLAQRDIATFFAKYNSKNISTVSCGIPFNRIPSNITFAFEGDGVDNEFTYEHVMSNILTPTMKQEYRHMVEFCDKYLKFLAREMQTDENTVRNSVHFYIARYDSNAGMRMHIDNMARESGTPVCTIHMGEDPETCVDFLPCTKGEHKPVRLHIKKGYMLIMGRESRYDWMHGIPTGRNSVKYSLMFKFPVVHAVTKTHARSKLLQVDINDIEMLDDQYIKV